MMLCDNFCTLLDRRGRPGFWDWMSDIPNCRTGNLVWDIQQLGVGNDLLDAENDGSVFIDTVNRIKGLRENAR